VVTSASDRTALDRGTVLALGAMAIGVFLIANDFTALSVAIPDIEHDLDVELDQAQWVINGYTVVFGVLIVTGGRLADVFGRRRLFMIGASIFGIFSLCGGLAPNIELLITCRALMGIGGALTWPAVLGLTYALLPSDRAGLAGGLIIGTAGLGNAMGPLLGGALTDALGWRWVFFLNVPVTVIALLVTRRYVAESRDPDAERAVDYLGIATLSVGVVSILIALDQGTQAGFSDPGIVALFVVGGALLVGFAFVERRQGSRALVPRDVMRNREFVAACVAILAMSAIFFAAVVYLPQFFEDQLGFSAVKSGAGLLPMMAVFAAASFVAGSLYDRLGPKVVVTAGAVCLGVGIFVLSFLHASSTYASLVPGMIVVGAGVGLFYSSITTAGVTTLDPSRSSLAGGIIYMCQIAGGSIGLGLNTALVLSASDQAEGIRAAFRLDAALALIGVFVALRYIGSTEERTARRHLRLHHRAHAS
jgi:EmrB/QacA subfamily drug resistance transporter